jgi:hypothetical protein
LAPAIIEGLEILMSIKEGNLSPTWHQPSTNGSGNLIARIGEGEANRLFEKTD